MNATLFCIFLLKIHTMGILHKNRAFFLFLLKFGITYCLLSLLYWAYLGQYDAGRFETDSFTHVVAKQSRWLVEKMGYEAKLEPHHAEASYRLSVNGMRMARVVEGCNALSIMILFAAFVVAFSGTLRKTILFIIAGIGIIHLLNIVRIALFVIIVYNNPDSQEIMHDIVFPLFIYGVVFALWVIWVTKFSSHAEERKA